MTRIGILASGSGSNAEKIIDYFSESSVAQVVFLASDNPDAFALTRASGRGVPTAVFTRAEFADGAAPLAALRAAGVGYIVLAGFLRLVPSNIIKEYAGRIVNIHPALLPAYGGKGMYGDRVHTAVIAAGESESGITIHRVNEHYDEGATIAQFRCPVTPYDTPETLAAKIHTLEHEHFPKVIEQDIISRGHKVETKSENMRLLLISNSTTAGQPYLQWPLEHIRRFLGCVDSVAFIPYAAVTFSYDEYEARVQARFDDLGIEVRSVHREADPALALRKTEAIVVGGGNTFALLKKMREQGLVEAVRMAVTESGTPYVGWSAGSNVCCPTICTTNDMPIVEPSSFGAVGAIPFQINPHYLDSHPDGHAGETRQQRIEEYIEANPGMWVAGLREGCLLRMEDGSMELVGSRPMRIFRHGDAPREVNAGDDLSFLWA